MPGGGKNDLWQGLNCKGKYAGELRIELTYYDMRPKPAPVEGAMEEMRESVGSGSGRVKRRPLPSAAGGHVTPDTIPTAAGPLRAKHGPRDVRTPPRANSMPPETMVFSQPHQPAPDQRWMSSSVGPAQQQTPPNQYDDEYSNYPDQAYDAGAFDLQNQADFLPQLPPSNRQRERAQPPSRVDELRQQYPSHGHPHPLPHSHSAPIVPQTSYAIEQYDDGQQLQIDYPGPIPDVEYQHQHMSARRRSEIPSGWQGFDDPYMGQPSSPEDSRPPPPPMHSNSAPVVPHYSSPYDGQMSSSPLMQSPPHARHHSVPSSSPLQQMERGFGSSQRLPAHGHPVRGSSMDGYNSSPDLSPYNSSPSSYSQGHTPSPYARTQPGRALPHRNSIAEPYQTTPSRPHPLSQEVPRPRSPLPPLPSSAEQSPYQYDYRTRDAVPLIKPRAISPQPSQASPAGNSAQRPRSSYSIQHPVRAFESSDGNPLSTSTSRNPPLSLQTAQRNTPARKSVSPHPATTPNSASGGSSVPFSPDSFTIHNPASSQPTLPAGNSPHSPYQISPGAVVGRDEPTGPIVNWHGQEIDPSDRLPVDSWAPEPEKKVQPKTYGMGRDRDFGPRSAQPSSAPGSRNLTRDTVINVRLKGQPPQQQQLPQEPESPTRNRLQKKSAQPSSRSPGTLEPLRERHNFNSVSVPDPYAQQEYSSGFYGGSSGGFGSNSAGGSGGFNPSFSGYASASSIDALAREISNIDIGSGAGRGGRGGRVGAPTAYVPVRSHRDRNTFY